MMKAGLGNSWNAELLETDVRVFPVRRFSSS